VTNAGHWHYVSTRNNNFSNRSQKGKIIVLGGGTPPTIEWGSEFNFRTLPGVARLIDGPSSNDMYLQNQGTQPGYLSPLILLQPAQLVFGVVYVNGYGLSDNAWQTMEISFTGGPNVAVVYFPNGIDQPSVFVTPIVIGADAVQFNVTAGGVYAVQQSTAVPSSSTAIESSSTGQTAPDSSAATASVWQITGMVVVIANYLCVTGNL